MHGYRYLALVLPYSKMLISSVKEIPHLWSKKHCILNSVLFLLPFRNLIVMLKICKKAN